MSTVNDSLWTLGVAHDTNCNLQYNATGAPTHTLCQVSSVGDIIVWGKASQWFHPKPLPIMTHMLLHTLAHVVRCMIISGSQPP